MLFYDTFDSLSKLQFLGADVYFATFDDGLQVTNVLPQARNDYVQAAADAKIKRQRFAVWRLLDIALKGRLGNGTDSYRFVRQQSGKWTSPDLPIYFSLSHSDGAAAVAISNRPVGVDVQSVKEFSRRDCAALANRILTEREKRDFSALPLQSRPSFLAELWASKESLFKLDGNGVFQPCALHADSGNTTCKKLLCGYVVAVSVV